MCLCVLCVIGCDVVRCDCVLFVCVGVRGDYRGCCDCNLLCGVVWFDVCVCFCVGVCVFVNMRVLFVAYCVILYGLRVSMLFCCFGLVFVFVRVRVYVCVLFVLCCVMLYVFLCVGVCRY